MFKLFYFKFGEQVINILRNHLIFIFGLDADQSSVANIYFIILSC